MDSGTDVLIVVVGLVLGPVFIVAGSLVRSGRLRAWVPLYRDPSLSRSLRHGAFMMLPTGVAILGVALGGVLVDKDGWVGGVGILSFVIAFGCVLAAFVIAAKAPVWSKPPWLVAEEREAYRSGENARKSKEGT